jgi:hypothetical protein
MTYPTTTDEHDTAAPGGLLDHLNAQLDAPDEDVPTRRQPGQLIEVLVEGQDPYTVRVANRELIAYEKTAARHKEWPMPTQERPELGRHFQMTFCTFVAAKAAGRFEGTFELWEKVLEDWNVVRDVIADPTR